MRKSCYDLQNMFTWRVLQGDKKESFWGLYYENLYIILTLRFTDPTTISKNKQKCFLLSCENQNTEFQLNLHLFAHVKSYFGLVFSAAYCSIWLSAVSGTYEMLMRMLKIHQMIICLNSEASRDFTYAFARAKAKKLIFKITFLRLTSDMDIIFNDF